MIPLRAPAPLPARGRGFSAIAVAENRRQQILFAAAETISAKGLATSTVEEIMRRAGVDRSTFYRLFAGKEELLAAIHEEAFQQAMAITAGAFFAQPRWPERVWEGGRAFTQHIEQNPLFMRVSLMESNAGGVRAVQRARDLTGAFTIFLQEGRHCPPHRRPPSPLALEAIVQTNYEIIYRSARLNGLRSVTGLSGHLTHICLVPFLGNARTAELLDRFASTDGAARAQR